MDVLKQYLPLCWFKGHPLQLPSSKAFFQQNLAFYFVLEFFTQANMIPVHEAFVEVFMNTGLTLLFVAALLSLNRNINSHTYFQVASTVLFCENMVSVLCVPVIAWLTVTHDWFSYAALAGLVFWDYALITYIMKRVLLIDIFASLVIAFIYFASTYGVAYSITLLF